MLVPYAGAIPAHRKALLKAAPPPPQTFERRHNVIDALDRFWGRDLPEKVAQIVRECAAAHGTFPWTIISDCRRATVVLARQEAFYRLRYETTYSFPQIGRYMKRDHSTVLHGIEQYEWRRAGGVGERPARLSRMSRRARQKRKQAAEQAFAPRSRGRGGEPSSTGRAAR